MIRHAGLIAFYETGMWRGVLIEGPSGAGKSDLALRLMGAGFCLVADDRVNVFVSDGRLFGRAPIALKGLLEVRGVGVVGARSIDIAPIILAVQCVDSAERPGRLPELAFKTVAGIRVPSLDLWAFEPSAPDKLLRAIEHLGAHRQRE